MKRIPLPILTLALLLTSILCGAAEPIVDRAKAIAEIEKLGFAVGADGHNPFDFSIVAAIYTNKVITDARLERLGGLTVVLAQLKGLRLRGTQVTDGGLKHLKGFTQLQELDLSETKVTDAGLEHLAGFTHLRS